MKFKPAKMEAELCGLGLNPRLTKVVREEAIARFLISKERVDKNFDEVIMMKGELLKFLSLISASIRRKLRNVCYARFLGSPRFCCMYREYKLVRNLQISRDFEVFALDTKSVSEVGWEEVKTYSQTANSATQGLA